MSSAADGSAVRPGFADILGTAEPADLRGAPALRGMRASRGSVSGWR